MCLEIFLSSNVLQFIQNKKVEPNAIEMHANCLLLIFINNNMSYNFCHLISMFRTIVKCKTGNIKMYIILC